MPASPKMDYAKLLGFDMVADEAADGVDFQKADIGAKLGAKVGKVPPPVTELLKPVHVPPEVTRAGGPIMKGLGGRTVSSN